ncbi:MAG: hypothetical protein C4B59_02255 [Candidatus Methanogaster sp.]|uniref:Uncharacterized protein n=1 Tax=Candidatus Methanogaster sp. TaxID=3386292 RepID=A0AC61L5J5_9EURY|nr:MAG: hypothetical protein C4B59_02255 [ANME-2 cluster archaeon]
MNRDFRKQKHDKLNNRLFICKICFVLDYLIDFKNMEWETPAPGVRYKAHTHDNHKIRLLEFTEEFVEDDWCTKGHTGYIVEGNLLINFNGRLSTFRAGDWVIHTRRRRKQT